MYFKEHIVYGGRSCPSPLFREGFLCLMAILGNLTFHVKADEVLAIQTN